MTEHDERPPEDAAEQDREESNPDLRPLPDGGLGENMPEWLRRPPAWRELPGASASTPASELEAIAPAAAEVERDTTVAVREMPPGDTSVIAPKTLIDFEDLPNWLQELGSKRAIADTTADESSADDSQSSGASNDDVEPVPESDASSAEHLTVSAVEQPVQAVQIAAKPQRDRATWQQGPFIALLMVVLLVAVSVAILYATGTF